MDQYINKAEIVEEIKKRIKENEEHWKSHSGIETAIGRGVSMGYRDILYFINTIEIKEVDLEKEIKRFTMSKELYEADSVIKTVAEHFFELGLKTKGE